MDVYGRGGVSCSLDVHCSVLDVHSMLKLIELFLDGNSMFVFFYPFGCPALTQRIAGGCSFLCVGCSLDDVH